MREDLLEVGQSSVCHPHYMDRIQISLPQSSLLTNCIALQNKPDVAFMLGEPFLEGPEQRTGTAGHSRSAQQQRKPASAQSTDLLGLPMEEELTQEEKQACY